MASPAPTAAEDHHPPPPPPTPTPRTHDSYEGSSADRSRQFRRQPYEVLDRHRDREYKLSAHNGFGQFLQYQRLSVDCGICHKPLRDTNYGNSPFDKPRRQWHHRDHWEYSTDVFGQLGKNHRDWSREHRNVLRDSRRCHRYSLFPRWRECQRCNYEQVRYPESAKF